MSRAGFSTLFVFAFLLTSTGVRADEGYFDSVGGVKIFYSVRGEGEPVLLIHAFRASQFTGWAMPGVIKLLAEKYKVISFDNRGHGRSDKPTTRDAYGATMVEDSVGLLDHLGVESAHVVGYSMGGMIALKMMAQYPERVRSAVIGGAGWTQPTPEDERNYIISSPDRHSAARIACGQSFYDLDLTEQQLRGIETLFMLIVGGADNLFKREIELLSGVRPDVPVQIVPGGTHISTVGRKEFRHGILGFIDSQSAHE